MRIGMEGSCLYRLVALSNEQPRLQRIIVDSNKATEEQQHFKLEQIMLYAVITSFIEIFTN
jgi:hypothetical protein